MIAEIIVLGSVGLAIVFTIAWLLRPDLRAWIERPNHRFQAELRQYDRVQCEESGSRKGTSA